MADTHIVVRPAATSWGAVIGGWVATVGASVIFAPAVAGLLAAVGQPSGANELAFAVPVVLGLLLSYLVGGYVAGRMAGYRTSWHGMMTAFFTLFVLLVVLLLGALADRGVFAASGVRSISDVIPGMRDFNVDSIGNALSFGAVLGFLAAIFGGWLGGLLAPSQAVVATTPVVAPVTPSVPVTETRTERTVVEDRPHTERTVEDRPERLIPAFGRKGGEASGERGVDEVRTTRVERD